MLPRQKMEDATHTYVITPTQFNYRLLSAREKFSIFRSHYFGAGVFRMSHPGEQSRKTMEEGSKMQSPTKRRRGRGTERRTLQRRCKDDETCAAGEQQRTRHLKPEGFEFSNTRGQK